MDNTLYRNLQKAKNWLESGGEHMGIGERFLLKMLSLEELLIFNQDKELVEENREIHDAIISASEEYKNKYSKLYY